MTPGGWLQSRFGCAPLLGMAVVVGLAIGIYSRNPVLGGAIIAGVILVRMLWTARGAQMRIMVSPGGLGWTHPERGPGMVVWREIGALIVRQAGARHELAVYLVPRDAPEGRFTNAFMMTTGDLGLEPDAGEARIRAFVEEMLPWLPDDVVVDRETRRWFEAWGIAWPPAGTRR